MVRLFCGEGESMLKSDPAYAAENSHPVYWILLVHTTLQHRLIYYISTTQPTIAELTEEEIERGARYYMMNVLANDGKTNKLRTDLR